MLDIKSFQRDTRPLTRKISDFLKSQNNMVMMVGGSFVLAGAGYYNEAWCVFPLMLIASIFYLWGESVYRKRHLPIRLPATAGITDFGDPAPGHFKYNKARGMFFLGNSKSVEAEDGWGEGEEFWVGNDDMRRHFLVFGSTGSGKTVTLLGFSYNSLAMGSGLIYIDPKADAKLVTQIYKAARFLGREEDVRVLNFMTGNQDQAEGTKRSNSVNPFAFGDATSLASILNAMIPASEGDNAIFSERAISLMNAIMPPLVEMRDRNEQELSVETIRTYLSYQKFIELAKRANNGDFSDKVKSTMAAYVASLGLSADGEPLAQKGGKPDNQKAVEQFQYATMYFTRAMDSLATDYGYIYNVVRGEVDYRDVFFNRRILIVLLPALEKNESDIALLGKLVLFAIKNALASGLGSRIEGTAEETLGSRPSASNRPLLLVIDEYAALQVKGFAEAATQGRSLGASCMFANQDLAGFKKASDAEADQILSNTRTQVFMYQGDMSQTMDYIVKKCGRTAIMKAAGYSADPASTLGNYRDKQEANMEMTERAVATDFLKLTEGEYFLVFDDKFIVGQAFFDPRLDPKGSDTMRVNRLLMISPPEYKKITLMASEGESLYQNLSAIIKGEKPVPSDMGRQSAEIVSLSSASKFFSSSGGSLVNQAISVIYSVLFDVSLEKKKVTETVPVPEPGYGGEPSSDNPEEEEFISPIRRTSMPEEDLDIPPDERTIEDVEESPVSVPVRGESGESFPDHEITEKLARLGREESYPEALRFEAAVSGKSRQESAKALDSWIARAFESSKADRKGMSSGAGSGGSEKRREDSDYVEKVLIPRQEQPKKEYAGVDLSDRKKDVENFY